MQIGSGLLMQLERCGHAAKLANEHREISEDKHGMRDIKTEIARAWGVQDQATLPEADAAMRWLFTEAGACECDVGVDLDLVDEQTGEVLMGGRVGAIIDYPEELLLVSWIHADNFDAPEPEDDLGLLALGLATALGKPFRVATVALRGSDVYPRRSRVFPPEEHPALLARIKAAVSRPRIPCPGEWCNACRQNVYCEAWLARAKVALTVFEQEAPLESGDEGPQIPQLDITNDNAGAIMDRVRKVEKAAELAKEQVKAFVRRGGRVVIDGRVYKSSFSQGRESVDIKALKADGLTKYVKKGEAFETFRWVKA